MIFGLKPQNDFPKNWTPLEAVAVVKALDEEGNLSFIISSTPTLGDVECLGYLTVAAKQQEKYILDGMESDDDA